MWDEKDKKKNRILAKRGRISLIPTLVHFILNIHGQQDATHAIRKCLPK